MHKFVWDTSAIINLKESNGHGYSPARSFYKDFNDGWIKESYLNIFPALAVFELSATISRKHRDGEKVLRDFYLMGPNAVLYNVDEALIQKSYDLMARPGFDRLKGADLVFACIAFVEEAALVTLDNDYQAVKDHIRIIDLKDSLDTPNYRRLFDK